jgi:predicted DCC family thiol-disulfide oxidoreductase YuxK
MPASRVPVLLSDGECRLCNAVVHFMLRHDHQGTLHFAPLQSMPGQEFLRSKGLPADAFDSLIFVPDWAGRAQGTYLSKTTGALAAFSEIGRPWSGLILLRFVPAWLRDGVYTCVSRARYTLFGKYKPPAFSEPSWEKRFLAR